MGPSIRSSPTEPNGRRRSGSSASTTHRRQLTGRPMLAPVAWSCSDLLLAVHWMEHSEGPYVLKEAGAAGPTCR